MAPKPRTFAADHLGELLQEPLWVAVGKLKAVDVERIAAISRIILALANPRLTVEEVSGIADKTLARTASILLGEFQPKIAPTADTKGA